MRSAVVLGSFLVALIGAGSAHAECDITSGSEIKAPKTAAAGATLKFKAYNDTAGATLTVEAADAARPISHPYTRSDVPENWFDVTVKTERGDGPIRVRLDSDGSGSQRTVTVELADGTTTTVTVDVPPGTPIDGVAIPPVPSVLLPVPGGSPTLADAGGEQCHFELTKEIRLVPGLKTTRPRVRRNDTVPNLPTLPGYADADSAVVFDLIGGSDCNQLAGPLPGIVSVRGPGGSYTERFADICSDRSVRKRRSGHPRFSLAKTGTGETTLRPPRSTKISFGHRYQYALKVGGRIRERGVIFANARFYKGYNVWAGTDEFWNYCINEDREVWSKNGNLYCWHPGFQDRSMTIKRQPR